jgi:nanoRNase/pAp phosphatase (c-di-AMP/oligoRNAs hydrolase)
MALSNHQQIQEAIKKARSILIVLPERPSTDAITAGLALASALEKMQKQVKTVASQYTVSPAHQFLPNSEAIESSIPALQKFVIGLDISKTAVEELSYDIQGDRLNIFIAPKGGRFTEKDVSFSTQGHEHELVFILDTPDLEKLGKLYEENTEFFYQVPIVNIDHHANNEGYGQMKLLDPMATSTSEIIFELIKTLDDMTIDEYMATNLLTGIISKTRSFQTQSVTPRSLSIASHLVAQGARREEIVKNLYQNKSIETLRLWGLVLSKLQYEERLECVWSAITPAEAQKPVTNKDLEGVIDELIVNAPEAKHVMILYEEEPNNVRGLLSTPPTLDARILLNGLKPEGSADFTWFMVTGQPVDAVAKDILHRLENHLSKRNATTVLAPTEPVR